MNALLINPFAFNSAECDSPSCSVESAAATPAPEAAAVANPSEQLPRPEANLAATTEVSPTAGVAVAFSVSDEQYIPELFSAYAARRCKDIISPPLQNPERNIDALMLNAVGAALNLHPRDLDDDPPPLFLRKPRPAFLRALFELGGMP